MSVRFGLSDTYSLPGSDYQIKVFIKESVKPSDDSAEELNGLKRRYRTKDRQDYYDLKYLFSIESCPGCPC